MAFQLIDGRPHRLRHVYPDASGSVTVLGNLYGATWLPHPQTPTASALVEGGYSYRLGDAGEATATFPNAVSDDGVHWRERFNEDGHREFLEFYRDDVLEFVMNIQRVEVDRGSVVVSGPDPWALLRKAYERDRTWTAAPHEVVNAYTRVPVARLADDFDGSSLAGGWTVSSTNPAVVANGTVLIGGGGTASITHDISVTSDTWRATVAFDRFNGGGSSSALLSLTILNSASATIGQVIYGTDQNQYVSSGHETLLSVAETPPADNGRSTITYERRGRWAFAFVNGALVGVAQYSTLVNNTPDAIRVAGGGTTIAVYIDQVTVTEQVEFLASGSDTGDYVLPGDYPTGGLRGRYFNNSDLQGLTSAERGVVIGAPNREPYAERLDPILNTAAGLSLPLQPGNSGDYFSIRWSGAVYLRGDLGDYVFEATSIVDGVRVWVGTTTFSDPLISDWTTASGTSTGTWDASDHGSQAGWYPIVVEFFCDTSAPVFRLQFTPPGAGTYTDPGGATITRGTKVTVPATSLSPLGCYDGRIQGQSHFDVVTQAAQQYGYQLWCEPMSLESGEFPGRLVPRERVGRDTDVVLEVDDLDTAEPILNPAVTRDSSDQIHNLILSGSGLADGAGSQVTAEVTDIAALSSSLFAMEGVVDAGEIGFLALLEARGNAELALRASPWEEVRGTPRGQERLADTYPLTASLSAMRWRPGDGVRLAIPSIGVEDTEPRQMVQVSRTFVPHGRTGTQVSFRQRPRSAVRTVRGLIRASLLRGRSYQGRTVTIVGTYEQASIGAGAFTQYSNIPLNPGEQVVTARVEVTLNTAAQSIGIEINGTDRTSELGGGWTTTPTSIDIGGYATQASATDTRLFIRFENNGGSTTIVQFQIYLEVLR